MDLLSTTVTNVATPTILRNLHAPAWIAPWLGAAYALALGSMLVLGARLGDRLGARRVFLIGLCGFVLSSALCGLSPDAGTIVLFRAVQGAFGALLIPQGFTLLLRVFPRTDLGRVFGLFGPLMAVCSISGPVLAGLVISLDPFGIGWRAVFLLNVLVAIVLLPLAVKVLPCLDANPAVRLDPTAAALLTAGLLGVLGSLTLFTAEAGALLPAALAIVGLAALAAFVVQQRRSPNPLLSPSLFTNRGFVAGTVVGVGFFAVTAGLLFATTLYLQTGRGVTVLSAATIIAPTSVGIIVASFSTRSLIARMGRRLLLAGLILLITGTAVYLVIVLLTPDPVWLIAIPLFVCGLGMGCGFGTVFAVALGDIGQSEAGSASGALNAAQQLANAAGAALISSTYLSIATAGAGLALCLGIVLLCAILSVVALPLLPRRAADVH
ncbi:MFS transporter [Streptomyces nodosus]